MTTEELHIEFRHLLEQDRSYLQRLAAGLYPGDAAMQGELLQQVSAEFIPILRDWMERRGEPMPRAYFRTVWQNRAKRHYTSYMAHRSRHVALEDRLFEALPDEEVSLYQELDDLIALLPPQERDLIERYCRAESISELAEEMGASYNTTLVRLRRTVQKMKAIKERITRV